MGERPRGGPGADADRRTAAPGRDEARRAGQPDRSRLRDGRAARSSDRPAPVRREGDGPEAPPRDRGSAPRPQGDPFARRDRPTGSRTDRRAHSDRPRTDGPRESRPFRPASRPERAEVKDDRLPPTRAPELPEELAEVQLDAEVRRDLRGLRKEVAEDVSRHLVAAGTLLEDDPERALEHARYARSRASRLAVVREAVGLAAYRAGEWSEAIAELRAARRMGGGPGHLPVLADAERALGRPERALELSRGPEARALNREDSIELLMVVSGARRDLGELDAAVVGLQIPELDPAKPGPWSARLFYAYADALLAAGRRDESIRWFLNAAQADQDELTDATERLGQLSVDPSVVAHGQSPGDATADPAGASEEDASADPAGEVPPEPGSRPAVDTSC